MNAGPFNSLEQAAIAGFVRPSKLADMEKIPDYRGFQLAFEEYRIVPERVLGQNSLPSDWCDERILQAVDDLPVVFVSAFIADAINNLNAAGAFIDLVNTNKIDAGITAARALIDKIYRDYGLQFRPHLPRLISDWKYRAVGLATETPSVLIYSRAGGITSTTTIDADDPLNAITSAIDMQRNEWTGGTPETTLEEDVQWYLARQPAFIRKIAHSNMGAK